MKCMLSLVVLFTALTTVGQEKSAIKKTGWLVYFSDRVIWYDANMKKCSNPDNFFNVNKNYENGLIINYSETAPFYKSIAIGYKIKAKYVDPEKTAPINSQLDSIWIIPAKANRLIDTSKGEFPIGEHYIIERNNKNISIHYNITSGYLVTDIELFRKSDKRRYKAVKNYEIYPPH